MISTLEIKTPLSASKDCFQFPPAPLQPGVEDPRAQNIRAVHRHLRGAQLHLRADNLPGRVLHSFTSQLNLSAFYGIGGARRDCVARVKRVIGGAHGVQNVFLCQTRLSERV